MKGDQSNVVGGDISTRDVPGGDERNRKGSFGMRINGGGSGALHLKERRDLI